MNRTDRLLAIVLEIQGRRWARAEDLAATFEVSKRTIYRDIMALGQAGVPLMAVPGRGYALVEGSISARMKRRRCCWAVPSWHEPSTLNIARRRSARHARSPACCLPQCGRRWTTCKSA